MEFQPFSVTREKSAVKFEKSFCFSLDGIRGIKVEGGIPDNERALHETAVDNHRCSCLEGHAAYEE